MSGIQKKTEVKNRLKYIDSKANNASKQAKNLGFRPSKTQEHIYGQIARGLTDVLHEFELVGDIKHSNSDDFYNDNLSSLLPPSILQKLNLSDSKSLEGENSSAEFMK